MSINDRYSESSEPRSSEENQDVPASVIASKIRPPKRAHCAQCGSEEVSALPTFSAGSGIAYRPMADDIICRRCGSIGPYELENRR